MVCLTLNFCKYALKLQYMLMKCCLTILKLLRQERCKDFTSAVSVPVRVKMLIKPEERASASVGQKTVFVLVFEFSV